MGAGRTELMEAVAGRGPVSEGRILLNGRDITGLSIAERIDAGVGFVPEDRQRDGLVQLLSVGQNLSLSSLLSTVKRFLVSRRIERAKVDRQIENMHVKTAGPDAAMTSLSGGNQQKVVIGRALMTEPEVLLLDEPTRGIDVGAKSEIFALLFREAKLGRAILFVTSEVLEALSASHRIVIMRKGTIVREFDSRTATREGVMAASGEVARGDEAA
jgi:erythritol transport system ATP-binding protein